MLSTFGLNVLGIIFFRAETLDHALRYISNIFSFSLFKVPYFIGIGYAKSLLLLIFIFMIIEWIGRRNKYALEKIDFLPGRYLKWSFYSFVILLIGIFAYTEKIKFIYFQF